MEGGDTHTHIHRLSGEEAKDWKASKDCEGKRKRWMGSFTTGHSDTGVLRLSQDREAGVPMLTGGVIRAEWELGPQLANNELSLLLINSAYLASGTVPSILHA